MHLSADVNKATGETFTSTWWDTEFWQPMVVFTVSVTVYVPGAV